MPAYCASDAGSSEINRVFPLLLWRERRIQPGEMEEGNDQLHMAQGSRAVGQEEPAGFCDPPRLVRSKVLLGSEPQEWSGAFQDGALWSLIRGGPFISVPSALCRHERTIIRHTQIV